MERIKKRKLKFRCLFGGNDEASSRRFDQSFSPANPTTKFKFEAGISTSKQRGGNRMKKLLARRILNGSSAKKQSPSILAKLMGGRRRSSKNVVHSSDKREKNEELVCNETECKWIAKGSVPEITSQVEEGFESGHVGYYEYDYSGDESLYMLRSGSVSESEEITVVSSGIVFDHHDRLTHSVSHMSESSLIREATNIMLERWSMTRINEDEEAVNKVGMSGEMFSSPFPDKETKPTESNSLVAVRDVFASPKGLGSLLGNCTRDDQGDRHLICTSGSPSIPPSFNNPNNKRNVGHEDDADEKVYSEPSNQDRRKVQKDVFNDKEDMPFKHARSNQRFQFCQQSTDTYFKNEDPANNQPSVSDIDVDAQLSGPESDDDAAFTSDGLENINSRLQDLKKNIRQLTVESKVISAKLRHIPKVKHIGQLSSTTESDSPESAYMASILQTVENYATDPYWNSETTHHPIDPRFFNCLEEYYYEGTVLASNEKRMFYDYMEQMFIRTSKSKVAYPWVNPVKRESQLRLLGPDLGDQIRNVVYEIEKGKNEDFVEIYYDKELEWVQPTNGIDNLGKFIAELVLNDLLQEVIDV